MFKFFRLSIYLLSFVYFFLNLSVSIILLAYLCFHNKILLCRAFKIDSLLTSNEGNLTLKVLRVGVKKLPFYGHVRKGEGGNPSL